jgi:hypothetical protein
VSFRFDAPDQLSSLQDNNLQVECHCRAGLETRETANGDGALAMFSPAQNQPCLSHCLSTSHALLNTTGWKSHSMCIAFFHTGAARREG